MGSWSSKEEVVVAQTAASGSGSNATATISRTEIMMGAIIMLLTILIIYGCYYKCRHHIRKFVGKEVGKATPTTVSLPATPPRMGQGQGNTAYIP